MRLKYAFLALAITAGLTSCKEEKPTPPGGENIPTSYNFSPASYSGQTVRILLADSLMALVKSAETGTVVTEAQLESIYDNTAGLFADISANKKISDKIYGGAGGPLDMQMRAWFDTIGARSAKFAGSPEAVTTADGLYLKEFIEKSLMGGLFYHGALDEIYEELPTADNNTVVTGEGTEMQHEWDEAFGYFGATPHYGEMTDDEISKNPSGKDFNNDGKIDKTNERNFFFGRYAGSRDKGFAVFTTTPTDYTGAIFNGFIKGRYYIGTKDYTKRDEAAAQAFAAWDNVIGASAVKYAIDIKNDINNASTKGRWAEMKTFTMMTLYNKNSKMNSVYNEVIALIGDKPADITVEKVTTIIEKIKSAYGF